jgi:hypothetical protein
MKHVPQHQSDVTFKSCVSLVMKALRFFFLSACVWHTQRLTPMDNISMVKNAISHGLSKVFATLDIVHLCHVSTRKVIWRGKIGQHNVRVVHSNRYSFHVFNFSLDLNAVNFKNASDLWQKNQSIFQQILPLIDNAYDIDIRMCAPGRWAIMEWEWKKGIHEYILWVSDEIQTDPKEVTEFSVAHEVAHAILKHTAPKAETLAESRTYEMQADLRAAKILGTAQGGIQDFYTSAFPKNPIARLEKILLNKIYGATTHPLDLTRVEYLKKWQNRNHPGTVKKLSRNHKNSFFDFKAVSQTPRFSFGTQTGIL